MWGSWVLSVVVVSLCVRMDLRKRGTMFLAPPLVKSLVSHLRLGFHCAPVIGEGAADSGLSGLPLWTDAADASLAGTVTASMAEGRGTAYSSCVQRTCEACAAVHWCLAELSGIPSQELTAGFKPQAARHLQ